MKRAVIVFLPLFLLLCVHAIQSHAQLPLYNLRFVQVTNNCTYLDLKIQIASSTGFFSLYDANLVVDYTGDFSAFLPCYKNIILTAGGGSAYHR